MSRRLLALPQALEDAAEHEQRRAWAWLLAGAVAVPAGLLLGRPRFAVAGLALCVGLFVLQSVRAQLGLRLARRDAEGAGPAPYRARTVLVYDPNPRAWRPLLAVWRDDHQRDGRWARPDGVWRCDDELVALRSPLGDVVVHEAWVDAGPRRRSTPRWVLADAGLAVPHRWSVLGRWYVSRLLRRSDVPSPLPLTVDHGRPAVPSRAHGSFGWQVGWRVVGLLLVLAYIELRQGIRGL